MNEKLTASTYTITATGVAKDTLATTVTATAETATRLSIDSTKVALTNKAGSFAVSVRNQYDEEMTVTDGTIIATAYNKTQGVDDAITAVHTAAAGITLNGTNTKVGDVILVTLTYGNLAVLSGEVEVVTGKISADVTLGKFEKTGADINETLLLNNDTFKLPINIVDQYGAAMKLTASTAWDGATDQGTLVNTDVTSVTAGKVVLANGAIITSSNTAVIDLTAVTVGPDGVPVFKALNTEAEGSAVGQTSTINILIPSTGKSVSYTVKTNAARKATSLTGFSATSQFAAEKTLTESTTAKTVKYSDFTYADQYGKAYTLAPSEAPDIVVKDATSSTFKGDGEGFWTELKADNKDGAILLTAGNVVIDDSYATALEDTKAGVKKTSDVESNAGNVNFYAFKEGTEKLTFTLGTSTLTSSITVNAAVTKVVATTENKTKYTAGDNVTITLTAQKGEAANYSTNTAYNETEYVTFTTMDSDDNAVKTYNREVKFVNGVAKVTIPVTKTDEVNIAMTSVANKAVDVAGMVRFAVEAAAFDTWEVACTTATTITLTAKDKYGNAVNKAVKNPLVKVSAKISATDASAVTVGGLDSEGYVKAEVEASVVTITVSGLANGNVISVVLDGVTYTGTAKF